MAVVRLACVPATSPRTRSTTKRPRSGTCLPHAGTLYSAASLSELGGIGQHTVAKLSEDGADAAADALDDVRVDGAVAGIHGVGKRKEDKIQDDVF